MEISIERATSLDYGAIAKLTVEAYREYSTSVTKESWIAMRRNLSAVESLAQRARFIIARADGELAGSVAYCPAGKSDPAIFPPEWASLLLLAVLPRYRGYGIAKELIVACVEAAREDSAPVVGLFTSELMTRAQHLYETMGFRKDCELPLRHGLRYWRFKLALTQSSNH